MKVVASREKVSQAVFSCPRSTQVPLNGSRWEFSRTQMRIAQMSSAGAEAK